FLAGRTRAALGPWSKHQGPRVPRPQPVHQRVLRRPIGFLASRIECCSGPLQEARAKFCGCSACGVTCEDGGPQRKKVTLSACSTGAPFPPTARRFGQESETVPTLDENRLHSTSLSRSRTFAQRSRCVMQGLGNTRAASFYER